MSSCIVISGGVSPLYSDPSSLILTGSEAAISLRGMRWGIMCTGSREGGDGYSAWGWRRSRGTRSY